MFALFFILALVSADYAVEEKGSGIASVYTLDVCINVNGKASMIYKKEADNKYKECAYTETGCTGTEKCETTDGVKIVDKVPANMAYKQEGGNGDCSNLADMPAADIYYSGCQKTLAGSVKYEIKDNKFHTSYFTDAECKTPDTANTVEPQECDKCSEGEKLFCKQYNAAAFTTILMVFFVLFFLF